MRGGRSGLAGRCAGALLLALALLAAACGNSDDDGAAPTTTAAPATTVDGDAPTTTAADGGSDSDDGRDTFVSISGVPGVTDEEIAFAVIGTKANNPLGTCILDCYLEGIEAYFAWRNEEGGIYGRQLVVDEVLDDELVRNLERSQDVASSGGAFGAFVATLVASGFGALDDAGVPTFVWGIHATEAANREAIFGHFGAACATCTGRTIPYIMGLEGLGKAGVLGYGVSENSKVCARTTAASIEKYAADVGSLEVVYLNDDLAFGLPNGIGPEVTAMRNAGVEFIATCIDLNGMKTLGDELARQGMDDVVMYHPNTYNETFVQAAGGIFEGDYVLPQFLAFEADVDNAMLDRFREYMEATGSALSELAMIGWINADTAFEALLAAGPAFDRQAAIDGANTTLTAYDAGGLINPIDWSRQHVPPSEGDPTNDYARECINGVRVVEGRFVQAFGEAGQPWVCWPNDTLDWSEPVPTSFG
jgi:hypothetical protein